MAPAACANSAPCSPPRRESSGETRAALQCCGCLFSSCAPVNSTAKRFNQLMIKLSVGGAEISMANRPQGRHNGRTMGQNIFMQLFCCRNRSAHWPAAARAPGWQSASQIGGSSGDHALHWPTLIVEAALAGAYLARSGRRAACARVSMSAGRRDVGANVWVAQSDWWPLARLALATGTALAAN